MLLSLLLELVLRLLLLLRLLLRLLLLQNLLLLQLIHLSSQLGPAFALQHAQGPGIHCRACVHPLG